MAKRKGDTTAAPSESKETQAGAAGSGPSTFAAVFGEVVSLLTVPASHKHLFLADLEWLVVPPLTLRQFRLWRQEDRPIGFASWAFLSEEAEARMLAGSRRLKPSEWKSGDRAWLMDLVAPSAEAAQQMVAELKTHVFPDRTLKGMQQGPGGAPQPVEF